MKGFLRVEIMRSPGERECSYLIRTKCLSACPLWTIAPAEVEIWVPPIRTHSSNPLATIRHIHR